MTSLLTLLAATILALSVAPGGAHRHMTAPANTIGDSPARSAAPAHRIVVTPLDVLGGPGM